MVEPERRWYDTINERRGQPPFQPGNRMEPRSLHFNDVGKLQMGTVEAGVADKDGKQSAVVYFHSDMPGMPTQEVAALDLKDIFTILEAESKNPGSNAAGRIIFQKQPVTMPR